MVESVNRASRMAVLACLVFIYAALSQSVSSVQAAESWIFTERSEDVGLDFSHQLNEDLVQERHTIAGGLAIGDLDGDGWDDIFVVTGNAHDQGVNTNPNKLFISLNDGTFAESALSWDLDPQLRSSAGPLIADFNGDGLNDLAVGGVDDDYFRLYLNDGDTTFSDATSASAVPVGPWVFGMSAGDIDQDGDLDLFQARWVHSSPILLLKNDGAAHFTDVTAAIMSGDKPRDIFTPTFADVNGDNWVDLLLTSDFKEMHGGSTFYLNNKKGSFLLQDNSVITDENGMGAALADYDNDGDLDWFAASIYDTDQVAEGTWGVSGNRLYQNDGEGVFTDVTDIAGVRVGYWGWGACFADFNNDMHLDLYHVNGFRSLIYTTEDEFESDPARMFINDGDGTFTEQSAVLGVDDTGQGRAILCFDNDRDGDIDILVNNNNGDSRFFENGLDNSNHYIEIKLRQPAPNADAIGAKIFVTAGGVRQMRQIFAGGNFASSHPTAQHFGLAGNLTVSLVEIVWPDRSVQQLSDQAVDQYLVVTRDSQPPDDILQDGFEQ